MNFSTIIGFFLAIGLIGVSTVLSVDNPALLFNPLGLAIVFVGTIASTILSYSLSDVAHAARVFLVFFRREKLYLEHDLEEASEIATKIRAGNIASLEEAAKQVSNPYLRYGLELIIDNKSSGEVAEIMAFQTERMAAREEREADMFRSMGTFAPAFGMLGTLLGLINMLNGMTGDIAAIGTNLAVALMTTFYGLIAANIIFLPLANQWEARTAKRVQARSVLNETLMLLANHTLPGRLREQASHLKSEIPSM
jgi:chemotaxis protein MotA